jgi:hypothetical protein
MSSYRHLQHTGVTTNTHKTLPSGETKRLDSVYNISLTAHTHTHTPQKHTHTHTHTHNKNTHTRASAPFKLSWLYPNCLTACTHLSALNTNTPNFYVFQQPQNLTFIFRWSNMSADGASTPVRCPQNVCWQGGIRDLLRRCTWTACIVVDEDAYCATDW